MRFVWLLCVCVLGCAQGAVGQSQVPPRMPVEQFFKTPSVAAMQVSPGGKWLGWLMPANGRQNVHIMPAQSGGPRCITNEASRDIASFFWKGDDWLVYSKDSAGNENFHLYAVRTDGTGQRELTPFPGARASVLDDLPDHPTDILITLNRRNARFFDVYRLNVVTGELTIALENPGQYTRFLTDHAGRIRIAIATDGVNNTLFHRANEQAEFTQVLTTGFRDAVTPLFFTSNNDSLYVLSNRGRDRLVLTTLSLRNGTEGRVLYEHPVVDVSSATYSRKLKRIAEVYYTFQYPETEYWEESWRMAFKQTFTQFGATFSSGNDKLVIVNTDDAERLFLLRSYSDRTYGAYYLYDATTRQARKIEDIAPWLSRDKMAEMKPIEILTRDGLTLHGYLTTPPGLTENRNLPMVLLVHGGPWARDGWGFNPQVQFLANRGYAVLQVNFRGSTGYGRKFWEASFGQWGLKMQDDLTDAVRWATRSGLADSNRVCIFGGSYGGYATLAGASLTPHLYCCAVDIVGVSNLFTFMNTIPPYWAPMLAMMHEMVGNPSTADSVRMRRTSPVFLADSICIPMLIAQGGQDPRVNRAESEQMIAALRGRNVPVHYFLRENEGHGFRNEENRLAFYRLVDQFLAENLQTPQVQRGPNGRWKPMSPNRVRQVQDLGPPAEGR